MKVYDLRTFKALPPVSFSEGPGFINILPRRASSIVITSTRGLVNVVDTTNPVGGGEFYQVSLSCINASSALTTREKLDVNSYISSVAVSATGVYVAFGDADGNIQLMTAGDEEGELPFNGFEGQPVEWPDVPEPIPDMEWTDSTPLNSIGMPYYDSLLLSSWSSKLLPPNPTYPPPPKIPTQILNSMKVTEFVGYATMPKELQGKRNVVSTDLKKDMGRFRSARPRSGEVSLWISTFLQDIELLRRLNLKLRLRKVLKKFRAHIAKSPSSTQNSGSKTSTLREFTFSYIWAHGSYPEPIDSTTRLSIADSSRTSSIRTRTRSYKLCITVFRYDDLQSPISFQIAIESIVFCASWDSPCACSAMLAVSTARLATFARRSVYLRKVRR